MDKVLILLAGFPGTGKTYLCNMINNRLGPYVVISPDGLKEYYFDKYGYHNLEEKQILEGKAWGKYYETLQLQMYSGKKIMTDYPFSKKQLPFLQLLTEKYKYKIITIRLTANLDILYERQRIRDLDVSRHLSHIVTSYQAGDQLENRSKADNLLTYDEFIERCTTRGYDTFQMGELIEVDVSDFSKVNYSKLIERVGLLTEGTVRAD